MLIGYARVSTADQSPDLRLDALTASGVEKVYTDHGVSMAEFERSLLVERTQAGPAAAKARGKKLGRRPSLSDGQLAQARTLVAAGHRVKEVAHTLGVGRSTLYRALGQTAAA